MLARSMKPGRPGTDRCELVKQSQGFTRELPGRREVTHRFHMQIGLPKRSQA